MQRAGWLRARPWGYAGQADAAKIPSLACDRREGPPGVFDSANGTLGGEWQCYSHCHSVVNVRGGTLRGEWQCSTHCQAAPNVPHRNARGRVAVRTERSWPSAVLLTLPLAGERTGQCAMHCQTASSVPYWYDRGRVAVRPLRRGSSGSISWDGSFASSRPPLSSLFSLLDTASLIIRYAPGRGWGTSPRVAHLGYRAAF